MEQGHNHFHCGLLLRSFFHLLLHGRDHYQQQAHVVWVEVEAVPAAVVAVVAAAAAVLAAAWNGGPKA